MKKITKRSKVITIGLGLALTLGIGGKSLISNQVAIDPPSGKALNTVQVAVVKTMIDPPSGYPVL